MFWRGRPLESLRQYHIFSRLTDTYSNIYMYTIYLSFFLPLSHFFSALMLLSAVSLLNHMHLQAFQHSHQDCQKPLFHPSSSALTFPIPSTDVLQSLCVIVVVLQYSGINYSGIPCSATFTVINSLTFEVHISYFYRYEDFDAFLQSGCELSIIHTHTHAQFMWKLQYMLEGIT